MKRCNEQVLPKLSSVLFGIPCGEDGLRRGGDRRQRDGGSEYSDFNPRGELLLFSSAKMLTEG